MSDRAVKKAARALVESTLWRRCGDDVSTTDARPSPERHSVEYMFNDWGEYNPTKAEKEERRKAKTERQAKYRSARAEKMHKNPPETPRNRGVVDALQDVAVDAPRDGPRDAPSDATRDGPTDTSTDASLAHVRAIARSPTPSPTPSPPESPPPRSGRMSASSSLGELEHPSGTGRVSSSEEFVIEAWVLESNRAGIAIAPVALSRQRQKLIEIEQRALGVAPQIAKARGCTVEHAFVVTVQNAFEDYRDRYEAADEAKRNGGKVRELKWSPGWLLNDWHTLIKGALPVPKQS